MRSRWIVAVLLGALLVPATVEAQSIIKSRARHRRPVDLSVLGFLPYPAGFGAGIRVGIPLAHDGFIGSINDAVFLEPGAQFVYWTDFDSDTAGMQIPVLLRWDFYLSRVWTVFGEVGLVFGYFPDETDRFKVRGDNIFRPGGRPGFFHVSIGGGAMINFSERVSLRLDASTQWLAVGVVFRF